MFNDRLIKYRNALGKSKRDLAEELEISESYYNLIENGKRDPSKNFIEKLVILSEKPEEYWLYGIEKDDYVSVRDDFKSLTKAIDQLTELNLINDVDSLFNGKYDKGTLEELLIMALKADIQHIIDKKKNA